MTTAEPRRRAAQPFALTITDAVRVALMGIVFALVLSLALTPRANAQQVQDGKPARAKHAGAGRAYRSTAHDIDSPGVPGLAGTSYTAR